MCGPATAIGVATGVAQGASAIGNFQQGKRQTQETNQARMGAYRDQLALNQYSYNKELGVYSQRLADYQGGLQESELALKKSFTQLDRRAAERIAAVSFSGQDSMIKQLEAEGMLSNLPVGSRERALTMARGAAGRNTASVADYLLRARFGDIEEARGFVDQANSYRRRLFSQVPFAPTMAPTPTAPVMQSGPSALSLIGGLGSAALGGLSAGMSANALKPRPGTT